MLKYFYFIITGMILLQIHTTMEKFYGKNRISLFLYLAALLFDMTFYAKKAFVEKNKNIFLKRIFLDYPLSYMSVVLVIILTLFVIFIIHGKID